MRHGLFNQYTHEYHIWQGIKQRCYNMRRPEFANYGGRGITMCERWLSGFENFVEDMGACPPRHTIDRIDNNGNYEPGNCRWATATEQSRNRRLPQRDGYVRGSTSHLSKLSEIEIPAIRIRLSRGEYHKDIAKDYNVSKGAISLIAQGKTWKHVQ